MKLVTAIAAVVFATFVTASAQPEPTWYWDGESDSINISAGTGIITYGHTAAAVRTTNEAYAGEYSVRLDLPWAKAADVNYALTDVWCPTSEGTIEMMWKNFGPSDGRPMLFMLHCRWDGSEWDTNDGLALYYRGNGEFRLYYNRHSLGSVSYRARTTAVDSVWYRIRVRYKVGVGMSFQLDDQEPQLFESDLQPIVAPNWFHLMWGNDTQSTCHYYLDEMKAYDHWIDDGDSTTPPLLAIETGTLPAAEESTAYSATLAASGGTEAYTWDVSGLPAGVSVDGNTITGTPADTGLFDVLITVTDSDDSTASRTLTLDVRPQDVPLTVGTDPMVPEYAIGEGVLVDQLGRIVDPAQARPGIYMRFSGADRALVKVLITE